MHNVKDDLKRSLSQVLFDLWHPKQHNRATLLVSLGNYYARDGADPKVKREIGKLSRSLVDLEVLKNLSSALNNVTGKVFLWEPALKASCLPEGVTLSPSFNVGNIDTAPLVQDIEKLRSEINKKKIDTDLITTFIARKARESGDLEDEPDENKG